MIRGGGRVAKIWRHSCHIWTQVMYGSNKRLAFARDFGIQLGKAIPRQDISRWSFLLMWFLFLLKCDFCSKTCECFVGVWNSIPLQLQLGVSCARFIRHGDPEGRTKHEAPTIMGYLDTSQASTWMTSCRDTTSAKTCEHRDSTSGIFSW